MKKALCLALCLIIVCASVFAMTACDPKKPLKIVYLGDSIAEGLAGASPISERENYAYFAILGRCNGYEYYNRSVSGHKTGDMLEIIRKKDYGANMTNTHIREADIIHISILGNDILLSGFAEMLIEAAEDRYDRLEEILPSSRINISNIVSELKALNPDAVIIFQTVYNPADPDSVLISSNPFAHSELMKRGYDKEGFRGLAAEVLSRLNNVLWDYLDEHPGAFYISDVYAAYDEVYKANRDKGIRLIYNDGVHPSNEGHALAALTAQKLLTSLGLNGDKFVEKYKEIRMEQLERMFADTVDYKTVNKSIKKASTYEEVSQIYFDTIYGITPKYC